MEPLGVAEDKTWDRLLDGVCVVGGGGHTEKEIMLMVKLLTH